jgi:hypothetical protein
MCCYQYCLKVLGGSEQAQNSEFEYWIGQNVSPSLRFVLATAGVTALSLCYTGQADSRSHIEEIPRFVWKLNVQCRMHNSLSRIRKRSQPTLSHNNSLKSVVIFYHLCLFLSRSLLWYTHSQNIYRSSFPWVLHVQSINLITPSEDYRPWSVSKSSFF